MNACDCGGVKHVSSLGKHLNTLYRLHNCCQIIFMNIRNHCYYYPQYNDSDDSRAIHTHSTALRAVCLVLHCAHVIHTSPTAWRFSVWNVFLVHFLHFVENATVKFPRGCIHNSVSKRSETNNSIWNVWVMICVRALLSPTAAFTCFQNWVRALITPRSPSKCAPTCSLAGFSTKCKLWRCVGSLATTLTWIQRAYALTANQHYNAIAAHIATHSLADERSETDKNDSARSDANNEPNAGDWAYEKNACLMKFIVLNFILHKSLIITQCQLSISAFRKYHFDAHTICLSIGKPYRNTSNVSTHWHRAV